MTISEENKKRKRSKKNSEIIAGDSIKTLSPDSYEILELLKNPHNIEKRSIPPSEEEKWQDRERKRQKTSKGDDRIVRGEGDQNVTPGVTELALGGVTKMSPKEYTNNNKNISKRTPGERSTYSKVNNDGNGKTKEGVSKDFREGIFRNRIFEIYDNLHDLKPIEDLVDDGEDRKSRKPPTKWGR